MSDTIGNTNRRNNSDLADFIPNERGVVIDLTMMADSELTNLVMTMGWYNCRQGELFISNASSEANAVDLLTFVSRRYIYNGLQLRHLLDALMSS